MTAAGLAGQSVANFQKHLFILERQHDGERAACSHRLTPSRTAGPLGSLKPETPSGVPRGTLGWLPRCVSPELDQKWSGPVLWCNR